MVEYTLEQRIFLYDTYPLCEILFCKSRRKFRSQFAGVRISSRSTIHVNKVKRTGLSGRLHVNLAEGGPTLVSSPPCTVRATSRCAVYTYNSLPSTLFEPYTLEVLSPSIQLGTKLNNTIFSFFYFH